MVVLAVTLPTPIMAQRGAAPDSLKHIQSMEPRSGPPGTEVVLFTENLPVQARIHVGVGAVGIGFEELAEVPQGQWGEVEASVRVPAYATWERAVVFIIFNGIFSPIGISDPFHVTNADGLVRRAGTISTAEPPCVGMRDDDGFQYALMGDLGGVEPGDRVVVEAVPSEYSACPDASALDVVRVTNGG